MTDEMEITIRVPTKYYRAAQRPAIFFPIATLTGASFTLCPLLLFVLGSGSMNGILDWRVLVGLANIAAICIVGNFYFNLALPVVQHAWRNLLR